jgi:hypothetical protein
VTSMRFPCASSVLLSGVFAFAACRGNADNARRTDSASGVAATSSDTIGTQGRLANDATLTIEATPSLHAALRAAADSFASREAIRVVLSAQAALPSTEARTPDLIVLVANDTSRLRTDSTAWTLRFAELDSATNSTPSSHADSARLDSARRDSIAKQKAVRSSRARAKRADTSVVSMRSAEDSARQALSRQLMLTVPLNAPNGSVAERFVRYLLREGRATLLRSGVHVLPRLEVRGAGVPPAITALVDTVVPLDTARSPEHPPAR